MRSTSAGSVIEGNVSRSCSIRLSISTQDSHMLRPFLGEKRVRENRSRVQRIATNIAKLPDLLRKA
jgi:hypothetical protein